MKPKEHGGGMKPKEHGGGTKPKFKYIWRPASTPRSLESMGLQHRSWSQQPAPSPPAPAGKAHNNLNSYECLTAMIRIPAGEPLPLRMPALSPSSDVYLSTTSSTLTCSRRQEILSPRGDVDGSRSLSRSSTAHARMTNGKIMAIVSQRCCDQELIV